MADPGNERVTVAVLGERVDNLRDDIKKLTEKFDQHCNSHDVVNKRISDVEAEQKVQSARQGVLGGLNAAFTTAVGLALTFFKQ